jgi:hypothetical protein
MQNWSNAGGQWCGELGLFPGQPFVLFSRRKLLYCKSLKLGELDSHLDSLLQRRTGVTPAWRWKTIGGEVFVAVPHLFAM